MLEHEPGREVRAWPGQEEGEGGIAVGMGDRVREGAVERLELGKVGQVGEIVPQQGGIERRPECRPAQGLSRFVIT